MHVYSRLNWARQCTTQNFELKVKKKKMCVAVRGCLNNVNINLTCISLTSRNVQLTLLRQIPVSAMGNINTSYHTQCGERGVKLTASFGFIGQ